jgi:hypothetical protein
MVAITHLTVLLIALLINKKGGSDVTFVTPTSSRSVVGRRVADSTGSL